MVLYESFLRKYYSVQYSSLEMLGMARIQVIQLKRDFVMRKSKLRIIAAITLEKIGFHIVYTHKGIPYKCLMGTLW